MLKKFSLLTVCAAVFALVLAMAGPVWAGSHDTRSDRRADSAKEAQSRRQARGKSKAKPQPKSTVTEDNDGDGRDNQGAPGAYPNGSQHPSGKDRYDEPGGSGNQGNSQSDPDGNENGGADKPGGSGGDDIYDQDGNNGCGNDQDFEDDNNGNCGKPEDDEDKAEVEGSVSTKTCPVTGMVPVNEPCHGDALEVVEVDENLAVAGVDDVLGIRIARAPQPAAETAAATAASRVLPAALTRPVAVAGAVLPFTGGELLLFVAVALALIAAGAGAVVLRRSES